MHARSHVIARNGARLSIKVDVVIKPLGPFRYRSDMEKLVAMKNDIFHHNGNWTRYTSPRIFRDRANYNAYDRNFSENWEWNQRATISWPLICLEIPLIRSFSDRTNLEVVCMNSVTVSILIVRSLFVISQWSKEISRSMPGVRINGVFQRLLPPAPLNL